MIPKLYAGQLTAVTRCRSYTWRYDVRRLHPPTNNRGQCIGRQSDGDFRSATSGVVFRVDAAELHLGGGRFEKVDWLTDYPDVIV